MKTLRRTKSGGLAALVFCLATVFTLQANAQETATRPAQEVSREAANAASKSESSSARLSTATVPSAAKLQLATDQTKDQFDRKLAGHQVRGRDGKDLGNVKDFLVNPRTGEVVYGVVSTGGMGKIGDKLRLVPFKALQPGSKKGEFSVMLDKTQWEKVAVVKEDEFKTGRFTLADDRRRALAATFAGTESGAPAASFYTEGMNTQLVCASDLRDKNVRSGTKEIGSIEGLVIDATAGTATALFDPKIDFANGRRKFLVPLSELTFGAGKREPVTTSLTTADFESAFSGTTATTTASRTSVGQPPQIVTPTPGHDRETKAIAAQNSSGQSQASASVAAATAAPNSTEPSARVATEQGVRASAAASNVEASVATTTTPATTNEETNRTRSLATNDGVSVAAGATGGAATTSPYEATFPTGRTKELETSVASAEKSTAHPSATTSNSSAASTSRDAKPAGSTATANSEQSYAAAAAITGASGEQGKEIKKSDGIAATDSSRAAGETVAQRETSGTAQKSAAFATDGTSSAASKSTASQEQVAANSPTRAAIDENLTPTGQTSADQNPKGAEGALISSARAVRQSLDEDETLARLDVKVTPENGKLVLRGTVASEELKRSVEKKAKGAVHATGIENELKVENK